MTPDYLQGLTHDEKRLHKESVGDVLINGDVFKLPIREHGPEFDAFSRALADLIRASRA